MLSGLLVSGMVLIMNNNKYHIDVTPEEDLLFRNFQTEKANKPKNTMFGGVFWTVVGVHAVALGALATTSFAKSSTKTDSIEGSNKPVTSNQTIASTPSTPVPNTASKPEPVSSPEPVVKQPTKQIVNNSGLTKTYIVKQGDTITSIAKRYKLKTDKLLKINNIKDSNKIVVGQTLKFF